MLLKQIKQNENFLVDEILAGLDDDRGLIIWRNFIRRTRPYEIKFTKVLKGLFRQQEKEVLANMRAHPKAVEDAHIDIAKRRYLIDFPNVEITERSIKQNWLSAWLFAEMMWRKRFSNNGKIFIGGVLEDVGQSELTNLVVGIDFDVSSPAVQDFISKNADKFSFAVNKETIDSLRKQLIAGVKLGESIPELTKRVNKVFGFAEKYRATRIARTEIIRGANAGAEFAYIQSGVVKGKEWLVSAGACDFCLFISEEMNQRDLGEPFFKQGDTLTVPSGDRTISMEIDYGDIEFPPLHPSCKCTIIAVLK